MTEQDRINRLIAAGFSKDEALRVTQSTYGTTAAAVIAFGIVPIIAMAILFLAPSLIP